MSERLLGIDPGTAIVGWGVVEGADQALHLVDYGTIRTPANTPLVERVTQIYDELNALLDQFQPTGVGIEQLFFARNVSTALPVAHARGVMLLAAAKRGLPLREFTPMQIKQAITGYGGADKTQMQQMVRLLLGLDSIPRPDDAADAIAVALCYHQTLSFPLA
ncbi:MAG: crossover junction endodeoxyribonuclease RuvC [Anaerolineales bacterium]|nr:crossover junction endodeoxyribonuclease RuvC [Anaerolineales bacterium]MCB9126458.1 crossover junction endodeoxyribonuclease RuvC [Ardenticatenales bacterium]MCB9171618.1 crossover junction endodeoxyribonuclease RuvC [Ardenticatenales bacterium]